MIVCACCRISDRDIAREVRAGCAGGVNGHQRLLHDGRARGVLEAILWHGGEAQDSRDRVLKLSRAERDALVKFVESL